MAGTERAQLLANIAQNRQALALDMVRLRLQQIFDHQLSPSQVHALAVLDTLGPQPAGALAERLHISAPTATGLIDRLERDGLARRKPHPHDGRTRVIHATAAGVRAWRAAVLGPTTIDDDVLSQLSDDDLRLLVSATDVMRRAVTAAVRSAEATQ